MAATFTPGLKVSAQSVVLKDRRLPMAGDVLVSVGDTVRADQTVARTQLPGKVYPVNIANQLGVDPSRLATYMKKTTGDSVEQNEIIAATCREALSRALNFAWKNLEMPMHFMIARRSQLEMFLMRHYPFPGASELPLAS